MSESLAMNWSEASLEVSFRCEDKEEEEDELTSRLKHG